MHSDAQTVAAYLDSLEPARREEIERTLQFVREALPEGLEESMDYGMISWSIPLSTKPDTYNGKPLSFAALASQKQNISLYVMPLYAQVPFSEEEFRSRWAGAKKLNMGRSCVRYKSVDDIDVPLIEQALDVSLPEFIEAYDAVRVGRRT